MNIQRRLGMKCGLAVSMVMLASLSVAAKAQDATIQGLVIGRDGPAMSVRTPDTPRQVVVLEDTTVATQKGGFLGMGRKTLGIEQLVPGLSVKVEGTFDGDHRLVAKRVEFSRGAMSTAKAIDAGLQPTNAEIAREQDQLRSDRKDIEAEQAATEKNTQDIADTKNALDQTNQQTAANTSAIGQANSRIGTLDQYETKDTYTVNFANGRATVSQKDKDALNDFVKQVATTPGSMIEVQGYASKTGNAEMNQRLSNERADNVLAIIQQSGSVPMTRILAPAAMGVSDQVGDNPKTRAGQAANRRVVVTIVVNKGITGDTTQQAAAPAPNGGEQ